MFDNGSFYKYHPSFVTKQGKNILFAFKRCVHGARRLLGDARPTATVKEPSVSVRRPETRRKSRCLEREGGEPTGAEAGRSVVCRERVLGPYF